MRKVSIFLIFLIGLSGCRQVIDEQVIKQEDKTAYVYLTNGKRTKLIQRGLELEEEGIQLRIYKIIAVLQEGLEGAEARPTIPSSVEIKRIRLTGRRIDVYFDSAIMKIEALDFLLCRASIVKSLTSLEGVDAIKFFVNEYSMKNAYGKAYDQLYAKDVIVSSEEAREGNDAQKIILYFPSIVGDSLIQVNREIETLNGESIERQIIKELRKLPNTKEVMTLIPEEAVVKSIEVKDGICYIDFNEAFIRKNYGGSRGELLTVYAIVNSLTARSNIGRVQFLIEGKKTKTFKGDLAFDQLFEYNIKLVQKGRFIND